MRIVQVDTFQWRQYGRPKVSTGQKLAHGFIRNDHAVCPFSDRDVAAFEAPFGFRDLGRTRANRRLLQTCEAYRPDLVLIGHADIIRNRTLAQIRAILPAVRIAYRNVDPLFHPGNVAKIEARLPFVDAVFVTTGGEPLRRLARDDRIVSYMPNPTDPAIETQSNADKTAFDWDLVFCGVGHPTDYRFGLVGGLHGSLNGVRFASFGMHGRPAVFGADYDAVLAGAKMGLNLNRSEGYPLYSSARIAQLMGNGLLTFVPEQTGLRRFFGDDAAVFFTDRDQLEREILACHADDDRRRSVAGTGQAQYRRLFSAERVARYVVETTTGGPLSEDYEWQDECHGRLPSHP